MRRRLLCDNNPSYIIAVYKPPTINSTTRLIGINFDISKVKTMYIDEVKLTSPVATYTFSDSNSHTVKIVMNENVTDMSYMFSECTYMTSLDVSNLDTSNVTNVKAMFGFCTELTSLDLSNFDTSKVTNMRYMFTDCSNMTSLDVSNFDTSNVTDMSFMFSDCSNMTSLDVSNFDTSNVTDMSCMFLYCNKLSVLNLYGLDTTNVTNMMQMFQSCSNLKTVLMDGDMSNVTDARQMFSGCTSLTSVVLFSANKIQPTSYSDIFSGITTAGTLYLNRSCAPPSFIGQIPTTWTYKALTSSPSPDYFS